MTLHKAGPRTECPAPVCKGESLTESIGQKLANAVVVKRGIDRRPSPVTEEERETLKKSEANLAGMKAEIASLMREMEVNSITSGVCWATLYHYGVEIGAYI